MSPAEINDALARIEVTRDALGLTGQIPRRMVAPDGGPCPNLLRWCKKNGVSLDWIVYGDVNVMIHATSRWRKYTA